MEDSLPDLKQSLRALLINPAFTLAVLAARALGIGANTAVFSLVDLKVPYPALHPCANPLIYSYTGDCSNEENSWALRLM